MTDATNTEAKYILESVVEERELALKEKLRIANEALKFYENEWDYDAEPTHKLLCDCGGVARTALEKTT